MNNKIKKIKGIDISSYNNKIDWKQLSKTDIEFIIFRSTTKNGELDIKFEENYKNALLYDFDIDVYHYSYALSEDKAINDAKNLIKKLNGKKVTIWLDLEWPEQGKLGKEKVTNIAIAFIKTCKSLNYKCNIYSNLDWYKNYYYADKLKTLGCKFWIARYGLNNGKYNEKYKPNVNEYIWQYTSNGTIKGISGKVDLNMKYIKESDISNNNSNNQENDEKPSSIHPIQKMIKVIATYGINKRVSPDTLDESIDGIYIRGTIINVVGITKNKSWYKDDTGHYITANNKWVTNLIGTVYNCSKLNMRDKNNSKEGKAITILNAGTKLTLLKKSSNGWYYGEVNGIKGWISGKYVKLN